MRHEDRQVDRTRRRRSRRARARRGAAMRSGGSGSETKVRKPNIPPHFEPMSQKIRPPFTTAAAKLETMSAKAARTAMLSRIMTTASIIAATMSRNPRRRSPLARQAEEVAEHRGCQSVITAVAVLTRGAWVSDCSRIIFRHRHLQSRPASECRTAFQEGPSAVRDAELWRRRRGTHRDRQLRRVSSLDHWRGRRGPCQSGAARTNRRRRVGGEIVTE